MTSNFSIEIQENQNQALKIITLSGELDESNLEELRNKFEVFFNDVSIKTFIFDLSALEFINSKGIGFLVSIQTHLAKDKRRLMMAGAKEAVMDVIILVGLTSIIPHYKTVEEAINNV